MDQMLLIVMVVLLLGLLGLVMGLWRKVAALQSQEDEGLLEEALQTQLQPQLQALLLEQAKQQANHLRDEFERSRRESAEADSRQRQELVDTLDKLAGKQASQLEIFEKRLNTVNESSQQKADALRESVDQRMQKLGKAQGQELQQFAQRLEKQAEGQREQAEKLREGVRLSMEQIRKANDEKLEKMRQTVDEKLQGTLEKRLGESFKLVSERLEKVQRGLGEMQELAKGVGDLKRVMTNVKTRGTWGEYQLAALLEQVLTAEQYEANVKVVPGSDANVEFAVKLPGDGEKTVWLPIDAKFPHEDYERIQQAVETADAEGVEIARKALVKRVSGFAKEVSQKYVAPPHTTNFAFLFLPTEGLYAELASVPGLIDELQRTYRVTLAGPSTLLAQLNALQMGFRTLAIQERSSEVWEVLGAVKTEFGRFGEAMAGVKKKLQEASNKVESVERRTRVMNRQLKTVEALPGQDAADRLGLNELGDETEV